MAQIIRGAALLLMYAFAFAAGSQVLLGPAQLTPATPTQADVIEALIPVQVPGACSPERSTTVTGTIVRTTLVFTGCAVTIGMPITIPVTFGPLQPNTYTYEIYLATDDNPTPTLRSTQTFTVTGPIPTLSPASLLALAAIIAVSAISAMRHFQ